MTKDVVVEEVEHGGHRYLMLGYAGPSLSCFSELAGAELEVTCRFVDGQSMKEVAAARGCSMRTIANQLASAYRKLGVSSRSELLALVHRAGKGA